MNTAKKPVVVASAATKRKNVQVVVRTRPISAEEQSQRCKNVVNCDSVIKTVVLKQLNDASLPRSFGPFDKVYGPEATQANMYGGIVAPLMKEVLSGFNCTIFAYGQTGSGKTYTMEGRHDESNEYTWETDPTAGIIPRAIHHIFSEIGESGVDATVRVSYVELYNEQIFDLLSLSETSQTDSLRIMEDKNKGVQVIGAEEMVVRKRDDVYTFLKRGSDKRRTASTLMNMTSSRSHSVFTVNVMVRETGIVSGEELLRQGKLNLVDLAGSENIGRSGAIDKRAREAGNINTSLLTLGRVITALTTGARHVPYRESKLTRILQDSLGGKTITTIIATLSPASSNYEESVNTLDYAQRAKSIKNCPEVNQYITRKGLLREYNEEIERLRKDLVAARTGHGIYLDKENYDNMIGTSEERKALIADLELRLEHVMKRIQMLMEDIEFMDRNYKAMFEKCVKAMEKLVRRKQEVTELKKDLATTNDNLRSANNALVISENEFVRLRSQAFETQDYCENYYMDIILLHDRLESAKAILQQNEGMLASHVTSFGKLKEVVDGLSQKFGEEQHQDQQKFVEKQHQHQQKFVEEQQHQQKLVEEQHQDQQKFVEEQHQHQQKFVEEQRQHQQKFVEEQQQHQRKFVEEQRQHQQKLVEEQQQHQQKFFEELHQDQQKFVEKQHQDQQKFIGIVGSIIETAQSDIERLVNQELKKIVSTGTTPQRPTNRDFLQDFVELPTASVLVAQQSQMVTPRRMSQFVERDSILDSTAFNEDFFSPGALKKQIEAKRKENGNENIKEEEE